MSERNIAQILAEYLGIPVGWVSQGQTASFTKTGPGRKHKQGKK